MIFTFLNGIITTILILTFIIYSVLTSNKVVASYAQLGDIQRREEVHKEIIASREINQQNNVTNNVHTTNNINTHKGKEVPIVERISFTIGVCNACLTSYLLGVAPTMFYLWYTPKAIILITLRWIDFRIKKQHYLLYDFCYWANAATLLYLWVYPKNSTLFQIVFLCANGPLAWSILAFNQSIVFHKWQQVVSVFIHVSPMFLTYGLRWNQSEFNVCDDEFPTCESVTWKTLLFNALFRFYLWWIVLYYCWIFVFLGPYIESRSFKTLYDRVAGNQMKFLIGEGSTFGSSHHLLKKAIYMLVHVLFGCFTMTIACLWWQYWWAHLSFVITICTCSCYNASKHYDDQFTSDRLIETVTNNKISTKESTQNKKSN